MFKQFETSCVIVELRVMQLADLEAGHASLQAESAQVTGEQARQCSSLEMALERERQRVHALERRSGRRLCMKAQHSGLALVLGRHAACPCRKHAMRFGGSDGVPAGLSITTKKTLVG